MMVYAFGKASLRARAQLHPKLRAIVDEAILEIDFRILDATRGRAAQNHAFKTGRSKAKFGQSAHNYVPAIAMDLFPAPYDWEDSKAFIELMEVVMRIAKKHNTKLRWGGDWDMKGDRNPKGSLEDLPHFELHPWRDFAAKSHLYEGD